jgi:hypothetical protein
MGAILLFRNSILIHHEAPRIGLVAALLKRAKIWTIEASKRNGNHSN